MLRYIKIHNYALIENVEISFSKGMTVITGETGSGKSILVSAILFVLGERFEAKVLSSNLKKSQKTVVEIGFSFDGDMPQALKNIFLTEEELLESEITLRREIRSDGKSRSFVNDSPIKQVFLKKIRPYLLSVYSQSEHIHLSSETYQMQLLDTYADNHQELLKYQEYLSRYRSLTVELEDIKKKKKEVQDRKSYDEYLLNELTEVNLVPGEQVALEKEQKSLSSVEQVQVEMMRLHSFLQEEGGLLSQFGVLQTDITKIASYPDLRTISDRIQGMLLDLKDVEADMVRFLDTLEINPQRLEEVNHRLSSIYDLQRKHNVNTVEALIQIRDKLQVSQSQWGNVEEKLDALQREVLQVKKKLDEVALSIYKSRIGVVEILSSKLKSLLHLLGMPDVRIRIDILPSDTYFANGRDEVSIYFSANQGHDLQTLSSVISGGEASRVMLAIKYILSEKRSLYTMLFDEIDVGVSGNIAHRMGDMMRDMSTRGQVIAITHLPQVAVKGDCHYKVIKSKGSDDERVQSDLISLGQEARLVEVAKMLSNGEVSDNAIEQAKALMVD